MPPPIRVLAVLESLTVTGPGKNLIAFAQRARNPEDGSPAIAMEVASYYRDTPQNEFTQAVAKAGIPVHFIHEKHVGDWNAARQLSALIGRLSPDVVQTHNCKSHLFVRLSGQLKRVPWIGFHHGYTTTSLKTRVYNQFDRFSLPSARCLVTVCRPFVDELARYGVDRTKISVVHNSVREFVAPDEARLREIRERFRIDMAKPTLVTVGRLSSEKGHRHLIEAIRILAAKRPELGVQCLIVGDGVERSALERQALESSLELSVTFCGQQSDVGGFYALANIAVLPSLSEGSPNALLESMAAGVASVATAVGGVPEIASHRETALIVPPSDPPALASAIERLLDDRATASAMAVRGRNHAVANFSPQAQTRRLVAVYSSAVSTR